MAKRVEKRGKLRTLPPAATAGEPADRSTPWAGLLTGFAVVLVGSRPIGSIDFWWDLARGRAVLDGYLMPSRRLLFDETLADADWLGGVPVFLCYALLGPYAVMLLRLVAAAAAAGIAWQFISGSRWLKCLAAGGFLFASSPALDPSGLFWDFWLLLALAMVLRRADSARPERWRASLLLPGCLLFLWANLGPRPLVGMFLLITWAVMRIADDSARRNVVQAISTLLVAAAAVALTPRGIATYRDAFQLTFPGWSSQGGWLHEGHWAAIGLGPQMVGFLLLIVVLIANLSAMSWRFKPVTVAAVGGLVLAQLPGWHNAAGMAIAAALLIGISGLLQLQGVHRRMGDMVPGKGRTPFSTRDVPKRIAVGCGFAVLGFAAWLHASAGLGWGLNERLDIRFVTRALPERPLQGSILADGTVTAGMSAWEGRGLAAHDIPHRALIGGRLPSYASLLDDLRMGLRGAYLRTDGSEGGWWLPLMNRETTLLLVSADDAALIEALEPTLWRPLGLDGPVIPLGRAGDPALNEGILDALRQQDIVEYAGWQYQPPRTTGSEYDRDRWGLRPLPEERGSAIRQARVFRAMGLPRAALRVLDYVRELGDKAEANRLSRLCHADLFEGERARAGRASHFRHEAVRISGGAQVNGDTAGGEDGITRAASAYVEGALVQALEALEPAESPEERYARASLMMEIGRTAEALTEFESLRQSRQGTTIGILAGHLAETLDAMVTPGRTPPPRSESRTTAEPSSGIADD